jgi:hypothetical protein
MDLEIVVLGYANRPKASKNHTPLTLILRKGGLTRKQISNSLQINLHIRYFDEILEMRVTLHDGLEYLLCYPGDNTFQLVRIDVCALEPGH